MTGSASTEPEAGAVPRELRDAPTLWALLARRAALSPDTPALIQAGDTPADDRTVTFGELKARAERTAAGLHRLGVRPGSSFVWQLPTRIETVVLSLALARLGAVQSPVMPMYRERELGFAVRETRADFLATPGREWRGYDYAALAERVAAAVVAETAVAGTAATETETETETAAETAAAETRTAEPSAARAPDARNPTAPHTRPRVIAAYDNLPEPGQAPDPATGTGTAEPLPPPPTDGTEVRWIYWTSGTTSDPKGVRHTDRSLIAGGACLALALRLRADDIGSIAFPYAHIGGPDYLVMLLLSGIPAVLFEQFALPAALDAYRRNGVTVAGGSTAFYSMFLAEQRKQPDTRLIPTLRLLAGGGAPKPPELFHEVRREMGCLLTHGYGMTEAPMITMGAPDDTPENLATTEGRPPAAMEIRVTDADGKPLPAGHDGEVRLRGEAVCQGYLDAAQSAAAFDADGFLITGDLGHLTESGHLVLTGRVKDIIIRKGENISAKEVEQLLYEHPAVGDVAVVGLPDPVRGELVCAVVEQPAGAAPLTLRDVTSYLSAQGLAVHKLPERLEVVDALPRNETLRKVLKYQLRERFTDA
ncbi:AMP-binding protein [Streptomyces sp. NPDC051940]|uniref:class I adenylate-forming enzyme family protein n=1 Tax=Streptomyces sp. NPDC051940 TaxID=3155675 RepID=UPI00342A4E99